MATPSQSQALSPSFQAAVLAVQEADMLMNSEYEPLNVHIRSSRDKENDGNINRAGSGALNSPSNKWVDRMVQVANACNTLVIKNCNLCHVYTNRQVEFERSSERQALQTPPASIAGTSTLMLSPTERVWQKMHAGCGGAPNSLEVNLYRQFLFDEESVVDMLDAALEKVENEEQEEEQQQKQETDQDKKPELHFV